MSDFHSQNPGVLGLKLIELTEAEVERLAEILNRGFSPTPALRKALARLAEPRRQPPTLHWIESED